LKPITTLFGSRLPSEFLERSWEDFPNVDLLIVAGTSLVVSPANSVVNSVPNTCVRMIVNREQVGKELGIEYGPDATRDLFAAGNCEEFFLELCDHLGWIDDLKLCSDVLPRSISKFLEDVIN